MDRQDAQGLSSLGQSRELLESNLGRLLAWIAAADAKLSPVLTINTAALGALAALAGSVRKWPPATIAVVALTVILLASSFIQIFLAMFPRTHGPKGSLVYFGGITEVNEDQFVSSILAVPPADYAKDLARQCYRNAQIAGEKFLHVKLATIFLLAALVPWSIAIYLLYHART